MTLLRTARPTSKGYPTEKQTFFTWSIRTDNPDFIPLTSEQAKDLSQDVRRLTAAIESRMPDAEIGGAYPLRQPTIDNSVAAAIEAKFRRLSTQWRSETRLCPTVIEMVTHPAYQQIIGMGRSAVPCILRDLAQKTGHWFWALKAITGEDPVPETDKGNLEKMTQAWLIWGARNGYEF